MPVVTGEAGALRCTAGGAQGRVLGHEWCWAPELAVPISHMLCAVTAHPSTVCHHQPAQQPTRHAQHPSAPLAELKVSMPLSAYRGPQVSGGNSRKKSGMGRGHVLWGDPSRVSSSCCGRVRAAGLPFPHFSLPSPLPFLLGSVPSITSSFPPCLFCILITSPSEGTDTQNQPLGMLLVFHPFFPFLWSTFCVVPSLA